MSGSEKCLQRALYCAAVLVLMGIPPGIEAKRSDSVTVSFALRDSRITLHEPVYVEFSVRNELAEPISFDLGFDQKQGFRFSITQPDGSTVQVPRYERGGIGRGGALTLGADEGYKQSMLLNELFQITKAGEYWITVKLAVRIRTLSGRELAAPPLEKIGLNVADRDRKRLAQVCERLAKTATKADYQAALDAAFALRYFQDPVAVPYLDRLITKGDSGVKGLAVTGLARIGTPEAVEILTSHLNTNDPTFKSQINAALWEIKTGVKLQIND